MTEDGTETTVNVSVEAELQVTVPADGRAVACVRYVFNDEEILTHYPRPFLNFVNHLQNISCNKPAVCDPIQLCILFRGLHSLLHDFNPDHLFRHRRKNL